MPTVKIMVGDVIERLRDLPDKSVHCCVTSPPYWGLRDYGTASWEGGDPECDHQETRGGTGSASSKQVTSGGTQGYQFKDVCGKCGAQRVDEQIGLEPTVEEFIEKMTVVFAEVWRVLRDDGTVWLNMGDCYAGAGLTGGTASTPGTLVHRPQASGRVAIGNGVKAKDLIGQPWLLAFALRSAGWYLRSDIIWHKPNPMPESCTDRPTKSHEYIFLLTKKPQYFYDQEAVKETSSPNTHGRGANHTPKQDKTSGGRGIRANKTNPMHYQPATRNLRDVWKISSQAFSEAHFATFPEELPRKCILAGTSEVGCCPECGAPVARVVEKTRTFESGSGKSGNAPSGKNGPSLQGGGETGDIRRGPCVSSETTGWKTTCECLQIVDLKMPPSLVPCTVLDIFGGAGTTGLVAAKMGRSAILTELSPKYANMAADRIRRECGLLAAVTVDELEKVSAGDQ